ncbi:hypothetical protein [Longimicrobium sp.]|jgi:hypothetical protein|uniref:hypothetical protein n=1 Tax=Longimicrobium sp. TaxID=2029185 RepID=UPI002EDA9098
MKSVRVFVLLLATTLASGCELIDRLAGEYDGKRPAKENVVSEAVIIRSFQRDPAGTAEAGRLRRIYLDRVRYLDARAFHDVNRIILGETGDLTAFIESLNLAVGDTVVVSTDYQGVYHGGAATGVVPNWPGDRYIDYPVAVHRLVEIRRKTP